MQFKVEFHKQELLGAVLLYKDGSKLNKVLNFRSVKPQTKFSSEENNQHLSGLKMESLG